MQSKEQPDSEHSQQDKLYDIVNRMLLPYGVQMDQRNLNALAGPQPPFDISKPNQHNSKAEFQKEYDAVNNSIAAADTLFETLVPKVKDEDAGALQSRFATIIDKGFKNAAPKTGLHESVPLTRKNIADVGAYQVSMLSVLELKNVLIDHMQELEDQKEAFWSLAHRAPDYYARAIALRLAKLFARETGQRPTYGTSGDTAEPSTTYSRALKEVFAELNFDVKPRSYCEWAVGQIRDNDMKPQQVNTLSGLLGYPQSQFQSDLPAAYRVQNKAETPKK